jgi:hypothetical protein
VYRIDLLSLQPSHNLSDINYAARLWQVFKAIISGALNELKELLGDAVTLVIETIEKHIAI